ncbi:MAG: 2Fe-2S iron-sulfur cluster binding domain-containing protein [Ruminococcaceae bacterium]|nr:2Fe-2S iron-sulfur cluster binding domain-containing protein [Oscillospiraceae bacterium]
MVNIKINGRDYSVPEGSTILEAARLAGIKIPTLCYLKDINAIGACRICVVEVKGARSLVAACVYPVNEGMEIITNSPKVIESRKTTLELIISNHKRECLSCVRSGSCELQQLCYEYGIDENKFLGENPAVDIDDSAAHMVRDNSKCILCRRCVAACAVTQGIGVIGANERGFATQIASAFDMNLADTACVSCGQCITACPTGALHEKDDTDKVMDAIADPEKIVVVQPAPAVRASLGEAFGYPVGTNVEGKMIAALRRLGFDKVFDTNFSADLTIMEEAHEFLGRVQNGGTLPMITSCSPGWIRYCENYFPEFIPNLSTCKSPQQMFGAIVKTYYAQKLGKNPEDIVSVSVMPCTAKKYEINREDQSAAGIPDVDITITTRELARLIKKEGIMFNDLPDEQPDSPLGEGTGAAVIFGATGGVMEAALRTAVWKLTGENNDAPIDFKDVRGVEGIKEAEYEVADKKVRVAVASGLANAKALLKRIKAGEASYDFIEIMACPGGCVNGGGQIIQPASVRNFTDIRADRAKVLYGIDESKALRRSHENPDIQVLYKEFLGEPNSHKAHEILHTSYKAQNLYK